jgi:SAM-dependent methyltransferase
MLEQAQALCPEVAFECASAHTLPFTKSQFDALFAFGCFHWFCNAESIEEIKRVLRPGGVFVVVNKKDIGSLREEFSLFLTQLLGRAFPEPKANYRPAEALAFHNFAVSTLAWEITEIFTAEELLNFCQSTSLWSSLSQPERALHLPALEQFVRMRVQDGAFARPIQVDCVIALRKTGLRPFGRAKSSKPFLNSSS